MAENSFFSLHLGTHIKILSSSGANKMFANKTADACLSATRWHLPRHPNAKRCLRDLKLFMTSHTFPV